jgi:hypothetical protein
MLSHVLPKARVSSDATVIIQMALGASALLAVWVAAEDYE